MSLFLTACDSGDTRQVDFSDRLSDDELEQAAPVRDSERLLFGFDLRSSPDEDAAQYVPFLRYLEQSTGLAFELRFTPRSDSIIDELGTGKVHFAAIGAGSYVQARERYGVVPVARGLNSDGLGEYQSVIVVAPDSPVGDIQQLRGKRFAFGSITSTQGHLIPRSILFEHGITLEDLAAYDYTGSHQNCASAVAAGRFHACGMQDILGRSLARDGLVRIIYTSDYFPSSGIAAYRNVPAATLEKVRLALLNFDPAGQHADGLYHWDRTEMAGGFASAQTEDYEDIRRWSIQFSLLDAASNEITP